MRATIRLRGQRNGNHTVMSSVMEETRGQEPGRTDGNDIDRSELVLMYAGQWAHSRKQMQGVLCIFVFDLLMA